MSVQRYYQRSPIKIYPPIITGKTAENGSAEDRLIWLKMLIGYMAKYPNDLASESEYPILPDGVRREMAGAPIEDEEMRKQYSIDAVRAWLTDDLVENSLVKLKTILSAEEGRFDKVIICYPLPLQENGSRNLVPAAMAAALKSKLETIAGLPVEIDLHLHEIPLHSAIKRPRGSVKGNGDVSPEQAIVGNKIANQLVVEGDVDQNALYWLIDDGITIGGTLRNYIGYIQDNDGTVGVATTLSKRSKGVEHLQATEEALHALRTILQDMNVGDAIKRLGNLLQCIGINVDFVHPERTTATNQEILLLAGYFSDPKNESHKLLMDNALKKIGTSFETSPNSYAVKAFKLPQGNLDKLESMVCTAMGIDAASLMPAMEGR